MTKIANFPLYFIWGKMARKWLKGAIFSVGIHFKPDFWWFFMYIYEFYHKITLRLLKCPDFWKFWAKMGEILQKWGPGAKIAHISKTLRLFCLRAYKAHFCYKCRLAKCLKTYLFTFSKFDLFGHFWGVQRSILALKWPKSPQIDLLTPQKRPKRSSLEKGNKYVFRH